MIKSEELFKAKQALNNFLHEHPELLPMQKEISQRLHSAVTPHNRMALLTKMMTESLQKLKVAEADLQESLKKLK